jgi:hypothetical protein
MPDGKLTGCDKVMVSYGGGKETKEAITLIPSEWE